MKIVLKRLYCFCVELAKSVVSFFSVIFFSSFKTNKYFKAEKKKRTEDNASCYLLCNGPSLQTVLSGADINKKNNLFVVNFFANTEAFMRIKPNYYIVLDNILVGRATKERMERSYDAVKQLYDNLSKVSWPLTLFFPSDGDKKVLSDLMANNNINVCFYNKTPVAGLMGLSHFLYRRNLGMPRPQNISNATIFCAINAGFKKLYLYGMEHSWMKSFEVDPETHKIFMNDGHFYKQSNVRWFKKGEYKDWLMFVYQAMDSHFRLRRYADQEGVKIINKTDASFIEAYEFEEY